jgi:hypothetical protein
MLTAADAPPELLRTAAIGAALAQSCWWGSLITGLILNLSQG